MISASETRLRQSRIEPLMPHLQVSYLAGGFGGGIDSNMSNFNGRGDGTATAYWELRNLGLGNVAENRTRRIQVNEAGTHLVELQAQVSDEVVRSAQSALARRQALGAAQEAVVQAIEMFRKLDVISFGMKGKGGNWNHWRHCWPFNNWPRRATSTSPRSWTTIGRNSVSTRPSANRHWMRWASYVPTPWECRWYRRLTWRRINDDLSVGASSSPEIYLQGIHNARRLNSRIEF